MRAAPAPFTAQDLRWMRAAIALAERGRGTTHPNPVVGAVVVKDGRVLARGWHKRVGGAHGEVDALQKIDGRAPGATLYVTLEPCCHTGRTGPCTEAVIAAGVARVVVGCRDENPLMSGKGIARLRRAGIRVDVGCLEEECRAQNRGFFRWIRDRRPWVTLKVAATLDGFIADRAATPGRIQWITGPAARETAHELRAAHDAVLVGAGTVMADDPRLTVRLPPKRGRRATPGRTLRVVLDGRLRISPRAQLLAEADAGKALVIGALPRGKDPDVEKRVRALERAGAEVLLLPSERGVVPLARLVSALAERGVQSLLVEGGARVLGAFISGRLVDGVAFFFAPRLAGGGVPIVEGSGLGWGRPLLLGPPTVKQVGDDLLVTADVLPRTAAGRR